MKCYVSLLITGVIFLFCPCDIAHADPPGFSENAQRVTTHDSYADLGSGPGTIENMLVIREFSFSTPQKVGNYTFSNFITAFHGGTRKLVGLSLSGPMASKWPIESESAKLFCQGQEVAVVDGKDVPVLVYGKGSLKDLILQAKNLSRDQSDEIVTLKNEAFGTLEVPVKKVTAVGLEFRFLICP
jgi:hypothetical protein